MASPKPSYRRIAGRYGQRQGRLRGRLPATVCRLVAGLTHGLLLLAADHWRYSQSGRPRVPETGQQTQPMDRQRHSKLLCAQSWWRRHETGRQGGRRPSGATSTFLRALIKLAKAIHQGVAAEASGPMCRGFPAMAVHVVAPSGPHANFALGIVVSASGVH
jgi:hypothetical protein